MKRYGKRAVAAVLCAAMVMSCVGCAKTVEVEADATSSVATSGAASTESSVAEAVEPAAEAEKVVITDFDEYVNGEWMQEQKAQIEASGNNMPRMLQMDTIYYQHMEDIRSLLAETDLSSLSEDDRFYKAALFYRQMLDTSDMDKRAETVKQHLEPITEIKSLDDLYKLYADKEYDRYNYLLNYNVYADGNGYNILAFEPKRMTQLMADEGAVRDYASLLGYSDDECTTLISNARKIADLVDGYYNGMSQETGGYYKQDRLDEEGVIVPVIEILGALDSLNRFKQFVAQGDVSGFLNTVFQEENIEALRDYYLLGAMFTLAPVYVTEEIWAKQNIDYSQYALEFILPPCGDAINGKYRELYVKEDHLQCAKELAEDVKNELRDVIGETEWLTPHGKELAKHKILKMRESYGENASQNDLSDVHMTDNVVENYISLLISWKDFFRSQIQKEDDKREVFNSPLFAANAIYTSQYTDLFISSSLMANPLCSEDASYEERLAFLGNIIAHEMSHTYAPAGMRYDYQGYLEDWLTEDEKAAYNEKIQSIVDFFDGKEVADGLTIDGNRVVTEACADILAMKCCLRLLEKQENPDYDLFFRTYAHYQAGYYTEEGLKDTLTSNYLPAKERINYVLAQFDKFYEVYNVDETSPYYVKEEDRLSVF